MVSSMPRWSWWLLVPIGVLGSWPWLAFNRLYDPDEFEHLHAAKCVADGLLPYRDYFEHHGPLTYYILAPFVSLMGDNPHLLTVHRAISGLWMLIAVAAVVAIVGQRRVGSLSLGLAWLFSFPWFLEKAVEGRPDIPAATLMAWSLWLTRRAALSSGWGWVLAAGLAMGTASLFTQKTAFLAIGIVIGGMITRGANGRTNTGSIIVGFLGFVIPWIAAGLFFHRAGGLEAFLQRTLITPLTWPSHPKNADEFLLHRLGNVISWAPGHLAVLAAAIAIGFRRLWNVRRLRSGEAIAWCGLLGHLLGASFVPAYLQYYLLAAPIAAVLVATASPAFFNMRPIVVGSLVLLAFVIAAVPRFAELKSLAFNPISTIDLASISMLTLMVAIALIGVCRTRALRLVLVSSILAAAFAPGLGRYVVYHRYWAAADRQRQDLIAFGELPPGPVLDGFSGLGCLRPHASYWWWINHHSLPLMRKEGALQGVLELVRRRVPAIVVIDDGVERVGGGIVQLLYEGYDLIEFRGRRLFIRRS